MAEWNKQLFFEDVVEGEEIPSVLLPCTGQRLVMVAGANMGFEPIHYDKEAAQKMGSPSTFANYQYIMMLTERQLREWCGMRGEIRKIGPFRMGRFTCADTVTKCGARVLAKRVEDGKHCVDLEVWQEDESGVHTMDGKAVVILPTRD